MLQAIYAPRWFYGVDLFMDILSALILLSIGFVAFRHYWFSGRKNHLLFAFGLGVYASGLVFKVARNFIFYSGDIADITLSQIHSSVAFVSWMVIVSRILIVLGLLFIFFLYYTSPKEVQAITVFLVLVSLILSDSVYVIFHMISALLAFFIGFHFSRSRKKHSFSQKNFLSLSFFLISISHILFFFISFSGWFYIIGEFVQLCGFILLFTTLLSVVLYGKKNPS